VEGGSWITARLAAGSTPARIQVAVDQTGLSTGAYSARIVVSTPGNEDRSVPVTLAVNTSAAMLDVSPAFVRLQAASGASDLLERALFVRNAGGSGPLNFQASVGTDSRWLTVTPAVGRTVPNSPVSIRLAVNGAGLADGVYRAVVHVDSDGGAADIPVSLAVQPAGPTLGLNFTGLIFQARQGNGNSNTRNVLLLNTGTGAVNWQAELISGGDWLRLSNASARGSATPENASRLALTADPGDLAPGVYYALIRISDPQAANSPVYFSAVLQVTAADAPPVPDPSPQGLFFVGEAGAPAPAQPFRIFVSSATPTPFQASVSTEDGGDWLSIDQTSGFTSTQNTTVLNVNTDASKLAPGVYTGEVTVALADRVVRSTNVTLVVPNSGTADRSKAKAAAGCVPSRLSLTQTGLVNSFDAPVGWPQPLIVRLADVCGGPVRDAQMIATFSSGDPPLVMPLTNPDVGLYSATWSPATSAPQVRITARATHPSLGSSTAEIAGGVTPNRAPILFANGTLAHAYPVAGAPLAPGSVARVTGLNLAASDAEAPGLPLPVALEGTAVLIGAREAPIFSASPDMLKILIPTDLEAGREYSILVNANGAYTTPDTLRLVPAQPGISTDETGMAIATTGSLAVSADTPARAGDVITIFVEGMGATANPIPSGASNPEPDPVQIQPSVTIDGKMAPVDYAVLAPGLVGVYQIGLRLPPDVPPGNRGVVVIQNGVASNSASLPVE
jgi:uncharacterized protein (TIGR03437 family)